MNTPRSLRLADGQLSSPYPPSPSFSSLGATCDVVLLPSCPVNHGLTDATLLVEYRFRVTRVAPSLLKLRSRSGPSLHSSALPRVLPRCLPLSSALSRFLLPTLPHLLHPGLSDPPSFISCLLYTSDAADEAYV